MELAQVPDDRAVAQYIGRLPGLQGRMLGGNVIEVTDVAAQFQKRFYIGLYVKEINGLRARTPLLRQCISAGYSG